MGQDAEILSLVKVPLADPDYRWNTLDDIQFLFNGWSLLGVQLVYYSWGTGKRHSGLSCCHHLQQKPYPLWLPSRGYQDLQPGALQKYVPLNCHVTNHVLLSALEQLQSNEHLLWPTHQLEMWSDIARVRKWHFWRWFGLLWWIIWW